MDTLNQVLEAIEDALNYYGMACNCGSPCEGTCTYAKLVDARASLEELLEEPVVTQAQIRGLEEGDAYLHRRIDATRRDIARLSSLIEAKGEHG